MSLLKILPKPTQTRWDSAEKVSQPKSSAIVIATVVAPPYGQRKGWTPRSLEDFGDGGAFPGITMAQYPLDKGRPNDKSGSNALAVQLDAHGRVKYDVLARQGHHKDKIVYSKLSDLLPADDRSLFPSKPNDEEVRDNIERTRQALEKITELKVSAAMPVRAVAKQAPAQFFRYTPSQAGVAFNSEAKERVIRIVELQKDPMEPPKFTISKRIPRRLPSPPAPVMHSPPRKATIQQIREWNIAPPVSNWKNNKGFTIPLDKRLAGDGRGLQQVYVNERFANLAEALYIADRKAREQVGTRAQLEKKLAQKAKEKKEEHLRALAQKARDERAGIGGPPLSSGSPHVHSLRDVECTQRHTLRRR